MPTPAASFMQIHADRPVVIAHRGASGHAPENTLASYREAIERGALYAETDVFLSRDGRVMAIHDETLERTTNGKGRLDEHTYDELRALDAGSWFDPRFASEKIPELGELLRFINGRMILCIEIKEGDGIEAAIRAILDETGFRDKVVFFSFNPEKVRKTKELLPDVPSLYLVHVDSPPWTYPSSLVDDALALNADAIGISGRGAHTVDIAHAHRAGLPVFAYTVNEAVQIQQMVDLGLDGIISDFPQQTRAYIQDLPSRY